MAPENRNGHRPDDAVHGDGAPMGGDVFNVFPKMLADAKNQLEGIDPSKGTIAEVAGQLETQAASLSYLREQCLLPENTLSLAGNGKALNELKAALDRKYEQLKQRAADERSTENIEAVAAKVRELVEIPLNGNSKHEGASENGTHAGRPSENGHHRKPVEVPGPKSADPVEMADVRKILEAHPGVTFYWDKCIGKVSYKDDLDDEDIIEFLKEERDMDQDEVDLGLERITALHQARKQLGKKPMKFKKAAQDLIEFISEYDTEFIGSASSSKAPFKVAGKKVIDPSSESAKKAAEEGEREKAAEVKKAAEQKAWEKEEKPLEDADENSVAGQCWKYIKELGEHRKLERAKAIHSLENTKVPTPYDAYFLLEQLDLARRAKNIKKFAVAKDELLAFAERKDEVDASKKLPANAEEVLEAVQAYQAKLSANAYSALPEKERPSGQKKDLKELFRKVHIELSDAQADKLFDALEGSKEEMQIDSLQMNKIFALINAEYSQEERSNLYKQFTVRFPPQKMLMTPGAERKFFKRTFGENNISDDEINELTATFLSAMSAHDHHDHAHAHGHHHHAHGDHGHAPSKYADDSKPSYYSRAVNWAIGAGYTVVRDPLGKLRFVKRNAAAAGAYALNKAQSAAGKITSAKGKLVLEPKEGDEPGFPLLKKGKHTGGHAGEAKGDHAQKEAHGHAHGKEDLLQGAKAILANVAARKAYEEAKQEEDRINKAQLMIKGFGENFPLFPKTDEKAERMFVAKQMGSDDANAKEVKKIQAFLIEARRSDERKPRYVKRIAEELGKVDEEKVRRQQTADSGIRLYVAEDDSAQLKKLAGRAPLSAKLREPEEDAANRLLATQFTMASRYAALLLGKGRAKSDNGDKNEEKKAA